MRRSDREITDFQELITVMRGCDVCRLALHDEPYPYILPLNFGLEVDGETVRLYFHGANTGTKYDLIAKNPNVAFEMDRGHELILDDEHGNCTMTYESVIGQGRITVVPDADKEHALRVLMAQYRAPDFPFSTVPEALQQAAARRLEYPDLSLAALCGCFDPPMSKSGLSHRMKKLEALADALRQRLEEHTETEEAGA